MDVRRTACLVLITLALASAGCITIGAPPQQAATTAPAATTTPAATGQADAAVTIGATTGGTIRPLLGVNTGPLPAGTDPGNADLTTQYKQYGVNLVRTHDYYGPLDMSVMYPDRTRDPAAASSYDFSSSDSAWKSITEGGFEPYFRLGDSWNDAKPPANALERSNWVRAGIEVLRHYRTGKWGGFTTGFRYVEVWNEPDFQQFWPKPRTPLDYFQLYTEAAIAIRQQFPGLRIGGPGVTQMPTVTPQGKKWLQDFLSFVQQKNAPLDFLSWHMYSNVPATYVEASRLYRSMLDDHGFRQARLHVTEWNTDIKHGSDSAPESVALRTGGKGAAIVTSTWIALQDNDIEVSTFYRGNDTSINLKTFYGLFYAGGRPKLTGLAFSLWSRMVAYPHRLAVTASPDMGLWTLAGLNDSGKTALLIANPTDRPVNIAVSLPGSQQPSITYYRVSDASGELQTGKLAGTACEIGANSVVMLVTD